MRCSTDCVDKAYSCILVSKKCIRWRSVDIVRTSSPWRRTWLMTMRGIKAELRSKRRYGQEKLTSLLLQVQLASLSGWTMCPWNNAGQGPTQKYRVSSILCLHPRLLRLGGYCFSSPLYFVLHYEFNCQHVRCSIYQRIITVGKWIEHTLLVIFQELSDEAFVLEIFNTWSTKCFFLCIAVLVEMSYVQRGSNVR